MSEFSKSLELLMKRHLVTAAQLCKACDLPKSSLSEWLSGREPRASVALVRVARYFNTTLDELIMGSLDMKEQEIVQTIAKAIETGFAVVHQGTYRLTIEKKTSVAKSIDDEKS